MLSGAIQKDGSGDDHKAMDSTAKFFGHSGRLNGVGGALEKKQNKVSTMLGKHKDSSLTGDGEAPGGPVGLFS